MFYLISSSEAEDRGNRICLKHATSQPGFVSIEKPREINSPREETIKAAGVCSGLRLEKAVWNLWKC